MGANGDTRGGRGHVESAGHEWEEEGEGGRGNATKSYVGMNEGAALPLCAVSTPGSVTLVQDFNLKSL